MPTPGGPEVPGGSRPSPIRGCLGGLRGVPAVPIPRGPEGPGPFRGSRGVPAACGASATGRAERPPWAGPAPSFPLAEQPAAAPPLQAGYPPCHSEPYHCCHWPEDERGGYFRPPCASSSPPGPPVSLPVTSGRWRWAGGAEPPLPSPRHRDPPPTPARRSPPGPGGSRSARPALPRTAPGDLSPPHTAAGPPLGHPHPHLRPPPGVSLPTGLFWHGRRGPPPLSGTPFPTAPTPHSPLRPPSTLP